MSLPEVLQAGWEPQWDGNRSNFISFSHRSAERSLFAYPLLIPHTNNPFNANIVIHLTQVLVFHRLCTLWLEPYPRLQSEISLLFIISKCVAAARNLSLLQLTGIRQSKWGSCTSEHCGPNSARWFSPRFTVSTYLIPVHCKHNVLFNCFFSSGAKMNVCSLHLAKPS